MSLKELFKSGLLNVSAVFKRTQLNRQNTLRKLQKGQQLNDVEKQEIKKVLNGVVEDIKKLEF